MADADVILKFEIVEGRSPDAEKAAQALSAFAEILRIAAAAVEPQRDLRVELVGVEPGSQVFKFALAKAQGFLSQLKGGMDEFPLVSKAAMTLGGLISGTFLVVGITNALTPDPRIPADQMATFNQMNETLKESVELQRQNMRFYGILQDEPAYERVDVLRGHDRSLAYSVPRTEFAARSGVWTEEARFVPRSETRTATWDVVLIKPVLIPQPRRWRFARDGLEFSALMSDPNVLQAIHDRTLPMQIAEGETMKIEVQYRETYDGRAWIPVPSSHRIRRVLHPLPPVSPFALFPDPGAP